MKVLLIPEDFRNDQYILKPIFERLFRSFGKSSLRVEVCRDPLLGGVREALDSDRLREIVEQFKGKADIFVCVWTATAEREGVRGSMRLKPNLETPSLQRMLGKKSRPGYWLG